MNKIRKIKFKIHGIFFIIDILTIIIAGITLPILFNYPPYSDLSTFQEKVEPFTHFQQYLSMFILLTVVHYFMARKMFKRIYIFLQKKYSNKEILEQETMAVRKDCVEIPYKILFIQTSIITLVVLGLSIFLTNSIYFIIRFTLYGFSVSYLVSLFLMLIIQRKLNTILIVTYDNNHYSKDFSRRLNFSTNLIVQVIPFLTVAIITIVLISYNQIVTKNSDIFYTYYKDKLEDINLKEDEISLESIAKELNKIELYNEKDYYFIKSKDKVVFSKEGKENSLFFTEYLNMFFEEMNGKIYEYYAVEEEASVIKKVDEDGEEWYFGFKYSTTDDQVIIFNNYLIIAAVSLYTIILIWWSRNIVGNIQKVSNSLKSILEIESVEIKQILPIMSNDEIGDLAYYYNKIQERVNDYIRQIEETQEIIKRQAQFATLGEVAGGIAHDLNSPLIAIKAELYTMKKYIESDKVQIEDTNIKNQLVKSIDNTRNSVENMGKTVNSMRDQIRNTKDKEKENFKLLKLVESIKILTGNYLRANNCILNINIPEEIEIYGEDNKLDRVLTNIIKNSMDAYKEHGISGEIDLRAEVKDSKCYISISDMAKGIPEDISKTLFKEMKTTKENEGTGFGLYYAYQIITGEFKGEMAFDTKVGEGTTFTIIIPIKDKEL